MCRLHPNMFVFLQQVRLVSHYDTFSISLMFSFIINQYWLAFVVYFLSNASMINSFISRLPAWFSGRIVHGLHHTLPEDFLCLGVIVPLCRS